MNIGGRDITKIAIAVFDVRHWRALGNIFKICRNPFDLLARYLFPDFGNYPINIALRAGNGRISPTVYNHHDILTFNEIFCRKDYGCPKDAKIVVDFGSNIGISALYFLTCSANSFVYAFEPLSDNVSKLKANLSGYENRVQINEVAVGLSDGDVTFGIEPTGRYGGINMKFDDSITVPCIKATKVIADVLDQHQRIDVLKIDIETFENEILMAIPVEHLQCIDKILIEQTYNSNPVADTHAWVQYGFVAHLSRLKH